MFLGDKSKEDYTFEVKFWFENASKLEVRVFFITVIEYNRHFSV